MNDTLIPELPGFDDPLGMLRACHERMLAHCDILERLLDHIDAEGIDSEARGAIRKVVTYFSTSAVHHHQDEEQDLFPILNRQSLKLADTVYRLKQDHEKLDRLWQQLSAELNKPATLAGNSGFAERVKTYCEACRQHIRVEDKELLMMAQHILSSRQLRDLGKAMARRRGQRYG